MRLVNFLDELNWTQTRLAEEAHVSISTVSRVVQSQTISRQNADKICKALTTALQRPIRLQDIDEIHTPRVERPERRKGPPEAPET
jgi:plasmid maintenance system antidote protein VapI